MATFPALEPNIRAYNFGMFPLTEESSLSAGTVRFSHSITPQNYQLTLGYLALSDADATLLRSHFQQQGGSYLAFELPSVIWKGHTFSGNIAPYAMLWRYAEAPTEEHLDIGRINMNISFVSDGTVDPELEVTASIAAGIATGA